MCQQILGTEIVFGYQPVHSKMINKQFILNGLYNLFRFQSNKQCGNIFIQISE
jgi:hypothetical protein